MTTIPSSHRNDRFTIAAVAVLAMCLVTFDHEALGHGTVCVFLHGHVRLLSSSLFRCDVQSGWIAFWGPVTNIAIGTVALVCLHLFPTLSPVTRLFLLLTNAFSYFWESGYLIRAMLKREGDLYFFAEFLLSRVSTWECWMAIAVGVALYLVTVLIVSVELSKLWPQPRLARNVARTAWISATVAAALAASAYLGPGWGDLHDAVLEIGGASFPLLFIPTRSRFVQETRPSALIARSPLAIAISAVVYVVFVASLGRGIVSSAPAAEPSANLNRAMPFPSTGDAFQSRQQAD